MWSRSRLAIAATGKEHLWEPRFLPYEVNVIVIHSVSAEALSPAEPFDRRWILKTFCDYGVSSHYLIERSGEILRLVPEEMKAWHAGGSIMPEPDNRQAVNGFSLGIELAASSVSGFSAVQYEKLAGLCSDIDEGTAGILPMSAASTLPVAARWPPASGRT